ncbi:MAG: hypothetical protein IT162_15265 [Bryobacterales bacterium]|nr:hypothetical protein [Bryobacterales bacterium]
MTFPAPARGRKPASRVNLTFAFLLWTALLPAAASLPTAETGFNGAVTGASLTGVTAASE